MKIYFIDLYSTYFVYDETHSENIMYIVHESVSYVWGNTIYIVHHRI